MTSEFHLPRSQAIFLKCFELANKSRHESQPRLQLSCYGASDNNTMSNEVLRVRCEKEEAALQVHGHSETDHFIYADLSLLRIASTTELKCRQFAGVE